MGASEWDLEPTMLSEHDSKTLLASLGFPVSGTVLADSAAAAVAAADHIGYPVALKIASADVVHKAAVGGVVLGLESSGAVSDAFDEIIANVSQLLPTAHVDGISVQRMAAPGGVEVLVGVQDDPSFGRVLAFGSGGSLVELLDDVSLRLIPLTRREAERQIEETQIGQRLPGADDRPGRHGPLIDLLMAVSDWISADEHVTEVDLNPVWVYVHELLVVDARIFLRARAPLDHGAAGPREAGGTS